MHVNRLRQGYGSSMDSKMIIYTLFTHNYKQSKKFYHTKTKCNTNPTTL